MKKWIASVCVLLFLFNMEGYYIWFGVQRSRIKTEVRQVIGRGEADDQLTVITVNNPSDLDWEKPGKEFRYHGEMYDVVRSGSKEGKTVYYCFNDRKESRLVSAFQKIRTDKETTNKILAGFDNKYLPDEHEPLIRPGSVERSFVNFVPHYHGVFPTTPAPPPKGS